MSESSRPKGPSPLVVRGIRRSFKVGERRIEILHGVDLDLHDGERLCLMGASGAGKTTLLNVIGLLDRPDEGSVQIMGTEAWAQSARACGTGPWGSCSSSTTCSPSSLLWRTPRSPPASRAYGGAPSRPSVTVQPRS